MGKGTVKIWHILVIVIAMAMISIGDAEKITGIKAHVLRYREQLIPLITPQKDRHGRRRYTIRDIQLLMRFDYLLEKHRLTPEQAREKLIQELAHSNSELIASIAQTKAELIHLYMAAKSRSLQTYRKVYEQD